MVLFLLERIVCKLGPDLKAVLYPVFLKAFLSLVDTPGIQGNATVGLFSSSVSCWISVRSPNFFFTSTIIFLNSFSLYPFSINTETRNSSSF